MRSAQLTGNLTREPELVPTSGEFGLIKFSIANNDESKKDPASGQYEDVVSFFDIQYWTKNPQPWLNKLKKGVGVVCDCDIKQDRWEQEGVKRSKVVFQIKRGAFPVTLAGKDDQQQQQPAQGGYTPPPKEDSPF